MKDEPNKVLPIEYIDQQITDKLLGIKLDVTLSTKQRGQELERVVAYQLGYKKNTKDAGRRISRYKKSDVRG